MRRARTDGLTLEQRFWHYVEKTEGCWVWTGPRNPNGYGLLSKGGSRYMLAHRYAFFLAHGREPNPHGLHACDNPACVRVGPEHVFEGNDQANHTDKMLKGHAGKAFTPDDLPVIRERIAAGEPLLAIATDYGCSRKSIQRIKNGSSWLWKGGEEAQQGEQPAKVLNARQVRQIRAQPDVSPSVLAERYGVSRQTIHRIRTGQSWG
jgi:hypothetical protein